MSSICFKKEEFVEYDLFLEKIRNYIIENIHKFLELRNEYFEARYISEYPEAPKERVQRSRIEKYPGDNFEISSIDQNFVNISYEGENQACGCHPEYPTYELNIPILFFTNIQDYQHEMQNNICKIKNDNALREKKLNKEKEKKKQEEQKKQEKREREQLKRLKEKYDSK